MNEMRNGNRPQRRRPPGDHPKAAVRQRQIASAGNARRNYERYLTLARDATLNGDVIEAENWYQHAEHYFRVMREPTN